MDQKDLYASGEAKMLEFSHPHDSSIPSFEQVSDQLNALAPGMDHLIKVFVFGQIYTREGLDNQQRILITLSSLVSLGTEKQLNLYINNALNVDVSPRQIIETFVHLIPYIGFPRVLNALTVTQQVFKQRSITAE